jgi:predicted anti-sigma-YlaC factor YlaD
MNCEEIQTRLSEYLDKSLDAISAKSIEIHLSACPLCRAEAAALADGIRQVAALPALDPPLGFAGRVMAHVRELERRPPVWRRLFFPLKLKIPIQATAVLLIGGLAVFLSHRQEKQRGWQEPGAIGTAVTAAQPEEMQKDAARELAVVPEQDLRVQRSAETASQKRTPMARQFVDPAGTAEPQGTAPSIVPPAPTPPEGAKSQPEGRIEAKPLAPRRAPIQAQEVATGREAPRPSFDQFVIGMPSGQSQPALRAAPFAAARSASPLGELKADAEFIVRRRGAPPSEQLRFDSSFFAYDLAAERATPPTIGSPIAEIRWFSVRKDLYEHFKKDLAAEASIESEKPAALRENDTSQNPARELLIKVIILSPAER